MVYHPRGDRRGGGPSLKPASDFQPERLLQTRAPYTGLRLQQQIDSVELNIQANGKLTPVAATQAWSVEPSR